MRHQNTGRKFSRSSSHRAAMFRNMVTSLIEHERITTTEPKAKELRRFAEKTISISLRLGEILGKTSPTPWGPWSDATVLWHAKPLYKVPEPYIPLLYAGKEHPSLADENGRVIYTTYIEFEEYYPHLIRVELE